MKTDPQKRKIHLTAIGQHGSLLIVQNWS